MSFFDEPKNAGTAIWIVGIVQMVFGLISIILGVVSEDYDLLTGVVSGIGAIIVGFLYFGFGKSIRSGVISEKWDIVCRIVLLSAMAIAINGIFGYDPELGNYAASIVISLIIAIIIFWIYKKMTDGQVTTADKVIWVVLLVVFVLSLITDVIELLAFPFGTILGLCGIVVDLFVILALLDSDIKAKMGM